MPLRGQNHSQRTQSDAPYFKSLAELDEWSPRHAKKLSGILDYRPRKQVEGVTSEGRGKLLVCHDYKGGYTESPTTLAYTFNFWSSCDTFVYFAHHRVTVPPPGWITAAHRNGVTMLGTLIFETSGESDCLRLLVGQLPNSKTGSALPSNRSSLPVSPHYARSLAELAYERGFDGYLLNFECPLQGGPEQTRALAAWVMLLERELKLKVGPHAQAIWYDSVIYTGHLRWQDRLNNYNLPFFLSSTSFFTNYTWPPQYPPLSAQYLLSLEQTLTPYSKPKTLQDIFTGVDVWGRGSHGNGGFGSYQAISHIDPEFLGLSVALFGPAWTWESEQDKEGWNWEAWWAYERKLWVGPEKEDEIVDVPQMPQCPHGPFVPITSFFPHLPPPNPVDLVFHTSFSPGVGRSWFVRGAEVLKTTGWTDIDKQCSLGDLVWPRPTVSWESGEREDTVPHAASALCMEDAWIGGNSLRLTLSGPGSEAEDAFFRCIWLPVQSLALTPQTTYEVVIIYKVQSTSLDVDMGLSVKITSEALAQAIEIMPGDDSTINDLPTDWSSTTIRIRMDTDHPTDVHAAVGLVIGIAAEDPSQPFEFSILLGQLSVAPVSSAGASAHGLQVLWADFTPDSSPKQSLSGVLTWEVGASFDTLSQISIPGPDDPLPPWLIDQPDRWLNPFLYFNIYILPRVPHHGVPSPERATFIGTTGLDGQRNYFAVEKQLLPEDVHDSPSVRFLVQGVTDRGQVLSWDRCAFIDVDF